jgi:large conductance mechanosensitive channel
LVIKGINSLKRSQPVEEAAPAGPTKEEALLMEIRDLLKNK